MRRHSPPRQPPCPEVKIHRVYKEKAKYNQYWTCKNLYNRTEQNRTELNRTAKKRAEQNRTDLNRPEQKGTVQKLQTSISILKANRVRKPNFHTILFKPQFDFETLSSITFDLKKFNISSFVYILFCIEFLIVKLYTEYVLITQRNL